MNKLLNFAKGLHNENEFFISYAGTGPGKYLRKKNHLLDVFVDEIAERVKSKLEQPVESEVISAKTLARRLDCSVSEVHQKIQENRIPTLPFGIRGAQRYEHLRAGQSETGTFTPKSLKAKKIKEITKFYLEGKMLGKAGYPSAKSCCKKIDEHLGTFRLIDLSTKPDILARHFAYFPETEWAQKYIWNYRTTLHSSVQFWIDTKELFMFNPIDRVKVEKGYMPETIVPSVRQVAWKLRPLIRPPVYHTPARFMITGKVLNTGIR